MDSLIGCLCTMEVEKLFLVAFECAAQLCHISRSKPSGFWLSKTLVTLSYICLLLECDFLRPLGCIYSIYFKDIACKRMSCTHKIINKFMFTGSKLAFSIGKMVQGAGVTEKNLMYNFYIWRRKVFCFCFTK
jgi:hypothetical protein